MIKNTLALIKHGKNWNELQKSIPSRTIIQIRTHAQKFFIKLKSIAPKVEPLEYLRSRPANSFISFGKQRAISEKVPEGSSVKRSLSKKEIKYTVKEAHRQDDKDVFNDSGQLYDSNLDVKRNCYFQFKADSDNKIKIIGY